MVFIAVTRQSWNDSVDEIGSNDGFPDMFDGNRGKWASRVDLKMTHPTK